MSGTSSSVRGGAQVLLRRRPVDLVFLASSSVHISRVTYGGDRVGDKERSMNPAVVGDLGDSGSHLAFPSFLSHTARVTSYDLGFSRKTIGVNGFLCIGGLGDRGMGAGSTEGPGVSF